MLFSHPYVTPTIDEYGLFQAKAAALRSADLSRQVGAVIMTDDGQIIAAGCNEVPRAGGGAVWEGRLADRDKDYRDFRIGHDSTARMKQEIMAEIFEQLKDEGWLAPELKDTTAEELAEKALYEGKTPLKGTRAASILEFGRMVHAEMSAISEAARRGLPFLALHYTAQRSRVTCVLVTSSRLVYARWCTSSRIRKAWQRIFIRSRSGSITTQKQTQMP